MMPRIIAGKKWFEPLKDRGQWFEPLKDRGHLCGVLTGMKMTNIGPGIV